MNIKHIFSFAVLAVMTAACSSEDIIQQPTFQSGQTLPFRATISAYAGTRGLTEAADGKSITAKWEVTEKIALVHGATIDVVKVESVEDATSATPGVATLSGDITNYVENEKVYLVYVGCQSGAMDDFMTALVQTFNAAKTADATITAITEDMIKANFKILYQDGTLTTINNGLDYRLATSTLTKTNGWVTLSDSPKLNSQFAIWKLTLKNASGAALAATQLDVIGVEAVASVSIDATTAAADPGVVYVMLPAGTADYRFDATVGTEVGTYTVTHNSVSLTAGKFYQSTLTMTKTVNLARLEAAYVAQDGDVLTGELDVTNHPVKISIADGATVTLNDVTINGTDNSSYNWAGITCEGDATIILNGTTTVKGFKSGYPGIYVPENKTITIQGTLSDKLTANNNGEGAAGIGGGYQLPCGNIVIEGGTITANGGSFGSGIGSGQFSGNEGCGSIIISGGKVEASGGNSSAGIGCGFGSGCGDITISGGEVKANGFYAGIGSSSSEAHNSTCGKITISGGKVEAHGGLSSAGIGSGYYGAGCGDIIISGGEIKAYSASQGAGIGSGFYNAGCGKIIISSGTIEAHGGSSGAGIGSGYSGSGCGDITITGGVIDAIGGNNRAAGIGSGFYANCGAISIESEITRVTATRAGDYASEYVRPDIIGRGDGGSCGTVTVDASLNDVESGDTRTITHP